MYVEYWGDDLAKLTNFAARLLGGYTPPILPGFAPMLVEFPKNIGKSRDKSYPTDQKTSSILVSAYRDKAPEVYTNRSRLRQEC